ncbi:MAG: TolC family protein [Terriglobales bacterium]
MRIRRIGFILFLLLATAAAFAAESRLTLEQAVAIALEKNPARKAAAFQQKAAATGVKEARAALLPQMTFNQSYVRSTDPVFVFGSKLRQERFGAPDFALNVLNTPSAFSNASSRISAAWRVFDSGGNVSRLVQARQVSTAAQRQLDRSDQELVYRVVNAYMGVLLAAKQAQVANDAARTAQAVLERSKARFESGMAVESDLLNAQVDQAARQQELIRARSDVQVARAALNNELGVPLESDYELAEVLAERVLPAPNEADLEQRALEHRPDLAAANLHEQIQRKSESMAKSGFGPKVNVFANWESDNPRMFAGGGNNWTTGVEVQFDVFDGGAKLARLQRERLLSSAAAAERDSMRSGVQLQVRKAYLDLDSARQQVDVGRAAVQQSKESLRIAQDRYEAGLSTITDLLRTEEAALRAETGYWQAVYRLQVSYANLELATGTLDANSPVVKP